MSYIKYRIIFHWKTLITRYHLLNIAYSKACKKSHRINGGEISQIKSYAKGDCHTANITKFKDQQTLTTSNNTLSLASTSSQVKFMLQPATLPKLTLHGCFSRFLNCTNGTKSRSAPHNHSFPSVEEDS